MDWAKDEYMGVSLILKSDPKRYGNLVKEIQNDYTRGVGGYPKTLSEAYDIPVNYQSTYKKPKGAHNDHDIAFTTFDTDHHDNNNVRVRKSKNRNKYSHHPQVKQQPDSTNNNSEKEDSNITIVHNTIQADCFMQQGRAKLPQQWLLLNSCSTINIISNRRLLRDLQPAKNPILVHCSAGIVQLMQQGRLLDYPELVWYHPNGIANILSLNKTSQYYHVTMDTKTDPNITVHIHKGNTIVFRPCHRGLYHDRIPNRATQKNMWSIMQTVEQNKEGYTNREITRARTARKLHNILMFPSKRTCRNAVQTVLHNCKTTTSDIDAADKIFGPNLAIVKGKTVWKKIHGVKDTVEPVPGAIMDKMSELTLCIDIFYVNNVPFIITMSKGIRFLTMQPLKNHKATTIKDALTTTKQLYHHCGFKIK